MCLLIKRLCETNVTENENNLKAHAHTLIHNRQSASMTIIKFACAQGQ